LNGTWTLLAVTRRPWGADMAAGRRRGGQGLKESWYGLSGAG
jgi:hypothetical protein